VVSFNYVHYLSGKSRVQPFLTAGLGIKRFSGPSNASAIVGGYVNKAYLSQFAWNYGGGTDLVLQRHLALRLELRDYVSGQPTVITGTGQNITGTSHNIVPSVGIVFRF
jgi:opacity protein-like surface antigen